MVVLSSQPSAQSANEWYQQGKNTISENAATKPITSNAKNVILFIGDGMGVSTVTAARIFEGQQKGMMGEENELSFEKFPHLALSKTYNTNQQTPDSAGTMTAMVSGIKNKAGTIGVTDDAYRGHCASSKGNEVISFLELAEAVGMSTGIVSTARITHATPAATYAKSPERNWEDDHDLSEEAVESGCKDIARQLIEMPFGDGIEVALGGGRRSFLPRTTADMEDEGATGERDDGRDLTQEWVNSSSHSKFVWNQTQFDAISADNTDRLLGLFERSHLEYEADRMADTGGEPSLADMTEKSIEILQKNDKGFFLTVEAGRIDHAHHGGNASRALQDNVAFADAIQKAVDMTSEEDTLIIVTADHSHVFTIAGYPTRGNDILGKVKSNDYFGMPTDEFSTDALGLPYTTLGYANGPGWKEQPEGGLRIDLTDVDTTDVNYMQEAAVPMYAETHAGEDVAIYARGPGAYLFDGVMEQNTIYHVMAHQNNAVKNVLGLIGMGNKSQKGALPSYQKLKRYQKQLNLK